MPVISYAQNFEDVYIHRAFKDVQRGYYVDIGAYDPVEDSVTKIFYDKGWSGVNVEPGPTFERFEKDRERDINLRVAIAPVSGRAKFFYHAGDPGTSTLVTRLHPFLAGRIGERKSYDVDAITLDELLERHAAQKTVHFLKIDIEGLESSVVTSADWRKHRPELLITEATRPYTNDRIDAAWTPFLAKAGYELVFFDGINTYYLREESIARKDAFRAPVNGLDGFRKYDPRVDGAAKRLAGPPNRPAVPPAVQAVTEAAGLTQGAFSEAGQDLAKSTRKPQSGARRKVAAVEAHNPAAGLKLEKTNGSAGHALASSEQEATAKAAARAVSAAGASRDRRPAELSLEIESVRAELGEREAEVDGMVLRVEALEARLTESDAQHQAALVREKSNWDLAEHRLEELRQSHARVEDLEAAKRTIAHQAWVNEQKVNELATALEAERRAREALANAPQAASEGVDAARQVEREQSLAAERKRSEDLAAAAQAERERAEAAVRRQEETVQSVREHTQKALADRDAIISEMSSRLAIAEGRLARSSEEAGEATTQGQVARQETQRLQAEADSLRATLESVELAAAGVSSADAAERLHALSALSERLASAEGQLARSSHELGQSINQEQIARDAAQQLAAEVAVLQAALAAADQGGRETAEAAALERANLSLGVESLERECETLRETLDRVMADLGVERQRIADLRADNQQLVRTSQLVATQVEALSQAFQHVSAHKSLLERSLADRGAAEAGAAERIQIEFKAQVAVLEAELAASRAARQAAEAEIDFIRREHAISIDTVLEKPLHELRMMEAMLAGARAEGARDKAAAEAAAQAAAGAQQLQQWLDEANAWGHGLEARIHELSIELDGRTQTLLAQNERLAQLKLDHAAHLEALQDQNQKETGALRAELERAREDAARDAVRSNRDAEDVRRVQRLLDEANEWGRSQGERVRELAVELAAVSGARDAEKERIDAMRREHSILMDSILDRPQQELGILQQNLEAARGELAAEKAKYENAAAEVRQLKHFLHEANVWGHSLESRIIHELSPRIDRASDAEAAVETLKAQLAEAQRNLDAVRDTQMIMLDSVLDRSRSEVVALQAALEQARLEAEQAAASEQRLREERRALYHNLRMGEGPRALKAALPLARLIRTVSGSKNRYRPG